MDAFDGEVPVVMSEKAASLPRAPNGDVRD